ncbi:MAG TPA: hypothetical protein DCM40_17880, partial [Maribacter sp.]|nr:hypothetical protein [Maribacter sp.]
FPIHNDITFRSHPARGDFSIMKCLKSYGMSYELWKSIIKQLFGNYRYPPDQPSVDFDIIPYVPQKYKYNPYAISSNPPGFIGTIEDNKIAGLISSDLRAGVERLRIISNRNVNNQNIGYAEALQNGATNNLGVFNFDIWLDNSAGGGSNIGEADYKLGLG